VRVFASVYIYIYTNTQTLIHTYTKSGVVATRAGIGSLFTVDLKNCFNVVNLGQTFLLSKDVGNKKALLDLEMKTVDKLNQIYYSVHFMTQALR